MPDRNPPNELPRGPHHLTSEEVQASQRQRMLTAVLALVDAHGLPPVTVAQIVREARVSKSAFYAQFANRDACFLAAVHDAKQLQVAASTAILRAAPDWVTGTRQAVAAYVADVEVTAVRRRAWLIESLSLGEAGLAERDHAMQTPIELYAALLEVVREQEPELALPAPWFARAVAGAHVELVSQALRQRSSSAITELEPQLAYLWVATVGGHDRAQRALRTPLPAPASRARRSLPRSPGPRRAAGGTAPRSGRGRP